MYSTNSAALTLATAASSLAAAQASTDIGRSLWTLGCGRRMSPRLGILRASEIDDLSVRPHDSDPGPRAVPPGRLAQRATTEAVQKKYGIQGVEDGLPGGRLPRSDRP
jgi:hypothetical protein